MPIAYLDVTVCGRVSYDLANLASALRFLNDVPIVVLLLRFVLERRL